MMSSSLPADSTNHSRAQHKTDSEMMAFSTGTFKGVIQCQIPMDSSIELEGSNLKQMKTAAAQAAASAASLPAALEACCHWQCFWHTLAGLLVALPVAYHEARGDGLASESILQTKSACPSFMPTQLYILHALHSLIILTLLSSL